MYIGGLLGSAGGNEGGYVRIRVDLLSAHALTEFHLHPNGKSEDQQHQLPITKSENDPLSLDVTPNPNKKPLLREKSVSLMINNNRVGGSDADNGNWSVEGDLHSSFLRSSIFYQDINKIPRNHLRYYTCL
jgi:hypothetical protein